MLILDDSGRAKYATQEEWEEWITTVCAGDLLVARHCIIRDRHGMILPVLASKRDPKDELLGTVATTCNMHTPFPPLVWETQLVGDVELWRTDSREQAEISHIAMVRMMVSVFENRAKHRGANNVKKRIGIHGGF